MVNVPVFKKFMSNVDAKNNKLKQFVVDKLYA